jgi:hypothetical protein
MKNFERIMKYVYSGTKSAVTADSWRLFFYFYDWSLPGAAYLTFSDWLSLSAKFGFAKLYLGAWLSYDGR